MRNFVKFIGKFLQEPVTILRTFIFPPLFFFFWVVFLALFSTLIFEEDSLGYIVLWSLGSIVVFLLSVTLFLRGLDQVQYYLNLDNLGSRTEERKNEQKPEKPQDNDTYKILSVRSDSYSAEAELAKLVNRHMLKGWRVVGGQSTTGGRRNYEKITQAMERDLPEDDPEPYDENDWRESRAKELGIYNSEYCAEISTIFREIHDVMLELLEDDLGYPDSKFHGEEFGKGGIRWWPDSKTDNPAWLDKNMPEYECFSLLQEQNIYSLTHAMNCYWGNGNYLFFYAYFDPFKINWKLEDNNEEFGR